MVMVVYLSQEEFVTYSRLMKTIAQTLVNSFKNNGSPVLVQKQPETFWFSSRGRSLSDCIPITSTSEQAVTAGLTSSDCLNSTGSSEDSGGKLQNKDFKPVLLNGVHGEGEGEGVFVLDYTRGYLNSQAFDAGRLMRLNESLREEREGD
ncbi:unnamed protein product [Arctogadus glacialis]